MVIRNQYIYEPKSFVKVLIELNEYCKENGLDLKRKDEVDENYEFLLDFNANVIAVLKVQKEKTLKDREIVNVDFDIQAKHQKVTNKVTNALVGIGHVVGAGAGAIVSVVTPGIGWVLGGAITTVSYGIGEIPGWVIGKIDESLSKAFVEGCGKHFSSMLNLFNDNLVDLTHILKRNDPYKDEWIDFYLSENPNIFIYTYTKEKENKLLGLIEEEGYNIQYNSSCISSEDDKVVQFYSSYTGKEGTLCRSLSLKEYEKGTVITNEQVLEKIENEWMSFCVDPIYDEEYKKRYELQDDTRTLEELRRELRRRLKY